MRAPVVPVSNLIVAYEDLDHHLWQLQMKYSLGDRQRGVVALTPDGP